MELIKKKIQYNFNCASLSYDMVASVQKKSAIRLVKCLVENFPEFYPSTVLDLGAGTGNVAEILTKLFPYSKFTLNDIAADMLAVAQQKLLPDVKLDFIVGDMEALNFGCYSLIITNLALQWVNNINTVIKKLYRDSNILAFSCLLAGTFQEWSETLKMYSLPIPTYNYPAKEELEKYILSLNPRRYFFDSNTTTLTFCNPLEFMRYLKNLGANTAVQNINISTLRQFLRLYKKELQVTYNVFFAILEKK